MKEYTIYIDGISKCLAATGVRVGWGFGPSHILDKMKALLTHVGAGHQNLSRKLLQNIYENPEEVNAFVEDLKINWKLSKVLHGGIQDLKGKVLLLTVLSLWEHFI
jgi:aspartate aminotransferase